LTADLAGVATYDPGPRPSSFVAKARINGVEKELRASFQTGRSFVHQPWVTAPAATTDRDGLGPLFNSNACSACHLNNGAGEAAKEGRYFGQGLVMRLSGVEHEYSSQFQDRSVLGGLEEGQLFVRYQVKTVALADGTQVALQQPRWQVIDEHYGDIDLTKASIQHSLRMAPRLIGMGLLDAIPEQAILARVDEDDINHDGISGKAAISFDLRSQQIKTGRYGWKAEATTLEQQIAAALQGDMGITSTLYPNSNCAGSQQDCLAAIPGGEPEIKDYLLGHMSYYTGHLAVPKMRNFDSPKVQQGWALFQSLGCESCHRSSYKTVSDDALLDDLIIHPFSDLLLHDMGEGLADNRPSNNASGSEWRTPPLWGIGHTQLLNKQRLVGYLHDGRARTLQEAILWHGGEAEKAQNGYRELSATDREALLSFLNSL
jgi:CxxC motif-containing protein (DUF1111 family)